MYRLLVRYFQDRLCTFKKLLVDYRSISHKVGSQSRKYRTAELLEELNSQSTMGREPRLIYYIVTPWTLNGVDPYKEKQKAMT